MKRQITVSLPGAILGAAFLVAALMVWPTQATLAQSGGAASAAKPATPPAQSTPSPHTFSFMQIESQATAGPTPTPAGVIGESIPMEETPVTTQTVAWIYLPFIVGSPLPTPTLTIEPSVTPDPTGEPSVTPTLTLEPSVTPDPTGEPSVTPDPTGEPTATATPGNVPSQVTEVIALTNQERVQAGCAPLQMNALLNQAAYDHTEDMALNDYVSHYGLDGSDPGDRIAATGYQFRTWGENIAAGVEITTAAAAVDAWMNSPNHRANILNCDFEEIGVGYYFLQNDTGNNNYYFYWTQVFASPW